MKTLKKTLCFVLAVVLCFGLVGTAFAADNFDGYTDAGTIGDAYVEAVDVMIGVGIIEGKTDTTINPTDNYTRAQAAKIIAYMKLGAKAASNLVASSQIFSDVPVSHWAAAYIQYCYNAGIISGVGNGKFEPEASLTGYQWGKMLLCAVGYGVNDEFEGDGWDLAVAARGIKIGVYNGDLGGASNAYLQRQQAILYAFNTLVDVGTVKWSSLLGDYVNTDFTLTGSSTEGEYLAANFSLEKGDLDTDAYGFGGYEWLVRDDAVSDFYNTGKTISTITEPTSLNAFKSSYGSGDFNSSVEFWYNGEWIGDYSYSALINTTTGSEGLLYDGIYAGATVYFVDEVNASGKLVTDGKIDKIIAVEESVGYVTAVDNSSKTKTATIKFVTEAGDEVYTVTITNSNGYAKGDLVLLVPRYDTARLISNELAKVGVSGEVTATGSGFIRVDGVKYNLAANVDGETITLGNSYDFYLDSTGAIVYVDNMKAGAAELNYVYLEKSYMRTTTNATLDNATGYARAQIVTLDGVRSIVDIYTYTRSGVKYYTNENGTATEVVDATSPFTAGFYSYSTKSDGSYVFTKLDSTKAVQVAASAATTEGSSTVTLGGTQSNIRATSTSVIRVANNGTIKTTTGYKNFTTKTYTVDSSTYILYTHKSGVLNTLYVVSPSSAAEDPIYGWYSGTGETTSSGTYYDFFVEGKKESYLMENGKTFVKTAPYEIVIDGDDVTATRVTTGVVSGVVEEVDTGYFIVNGTVYYYSDNCVVYDVTSSGGGAASSLVGPSKNYTGETVTFVIDSYTDAVVVYITAGRS